MLPETAEEAGEERQLGWARRRGRGQSGQKVALLNTD